MKLNTLSAGGSAVTLDALINPPAGIYVGTAGDLVIDTIETTSITVKAIAGAVLPWAVKRVHTTGTTAAALVTVKID